jgi:uncharacterized protein (DUF983 family)
MVKKGTKLYSIFKGKCPECHEGEFFVSHPYDLKHMGDIKETCSKCGLKYAKEPGFYFGAMYVAYALGVATFVTLWVSMNLFFDGISIGWQIGIILLGIVLLTPLLFSFSKIIWANMFISFKGSDGKKSEHSAH